MKKIIYFVSLFLFVFLLVPKNTYAYDETSTLESLTNDELIDFFGNFYKVNDVVMVRDTSQGNIFIIPVKDVVNTLCYKSGSYRYLYYEFTSPGTKRLVSYTFSKTSTISDVLNGTSAPKDAGTTTLDNSINGNYLYTTFDLVDYSTNNTIYQKNINNYTCTACNSCSNEGGDGPVEITNFPITKNEFYCLLILVSVLIFMLFFRWCFPMKGGKKL